MPIRVELADSEQTLTLQLASTPPLDAELGDGQAWHRLTISLEGPELRAQADCFLLTGELIELARVFRLLAEGEGDLWFSPMEPSLLLQGDSFELAGRLALRLGTGPWVSFKMEVPDDALHQASSVVRAWAIT